jgi:hypothetical protein
MRKGRFYGADVMAPVSAEPAGPDLEPAIDYRTLRKSKESRKKRGSFEPRFLVFRPRLKPITRRVLSFVFCDVENLG